MAIQMRRGEYSKFDAESMLPGEWAVVLSGDSSAIDGKAVYICTSAGVTKRMATIDDLAMVAANANPEIFDQIRIALVNALADIRDAESKRVTVENKRVENEKERIDAEDAREAAETQRQTNETQRQANESTRQSTYVKSASATTLSPSQQATAKIVSNVLQLGIPKGDKGDKGDAFRYSDFTSAQLEALRGPKGDAGGVKFHICTSSEYSQSNGMNVPTLTGDSATIYLTPKVTAEDNDAYDQWMYVNSKWDVIGGSSNKDLESSVDAIALEMEKRIPAYYYSATPTESTVKSEHTTPCLVVVKGGATYLVE